MRLAMFCAVAVLATCAQAKEPVPVFGKAEAILLKPTSHVCVSATVNDDIPSINHAVFTDEIYSGRLRAEIVSILETRPGRADVVEQVHGTPTTWPAKCKDAQAIFVDIRYTLSGEGKPFAVEWSVIQGSKKAACRAERDIAKEVAEGKLKRYAEENLIGTALADDLRARASRIAAIIR